MTLVISQNILENKVKSDIDFINEFSQFAKNQNLRFVVYGGYGLDGYLQAITRNHGDIDIVMYGQTQRPVALAAIDTYLNDALRGVEIVSKNEDFLIDIKVKSKSIQGNFYYVQTADDPFINLSTVIKSDGSKVTNSPKDFPPPVHGQLGELELEVQDQSAHLGDIFRKRRDSDQFAKHDQDIENIKQIME